MRLAKPDIGQEELKEIESVLESGWLAQGPAVAEFECMVAEYLGVKHAFATSSCTTALHLSLCALGIGPGDEVLLPDFTFPATYNVVYQCGATPVLVDIDIKTFTIDTGDLSRKLTPRAKAILPVHLFGCSADMWPILDLAKQYSLKVIEDAACALGATYWYTPCGTLGDVGCFSFHPRKIITTGEGGMIVTNDDELADKIALLRNHGGRRRNGRYSFHASGFNYRMSDVQAAIGIAQMRKLERIISQRLELAMKFSGVLSGIEGIQLPTSPGWGDHVYQAYVILVKNRDAVIEGLLKREIESTIGTYALHCQPFLSGWYKAGAFPNSRRAYEQSSALPFWDGVDSSKLANALKEVLHDIG